ncbi:hypothetical protein, partial [Mycobacterium tuberculosis]
EIRITAKQYDRAIKILQQKNLIIKKIYKFDKDPTTHIRLNHEQLEIEVNKWIANIKQMIVDGEIDEKGRKTNSPKGKKPVKTRDTSDSSKNDESNNGAQTQYYQGEEPKPLGNLVFPQMGKTNSPKREKGNSPNGKKEIPQTGKSLTGKTYRENIQGKHTGNFLNHHHKENPKDMEVVEKEIQLTQDHIQYLFNANISKKEAIRFLEICKKEKQDPGVVAEETYFYFNEKQEDIEDLMSALIHGAQHGWKTSVQVQIVPTNHTAPSDPSDCNLYNWVERDRIK